MNAEVESARPPDLRTFLAELRRLPDGLVDVHRRVSSDRELSAVVKATEPHGAPAVLFHDVDGLGFPVVVGLFGTEAKIATALGVAIQECVARVTHSIEHPVPAIVVDDPAVQECRFLGDSVDLSTLPFPVHARDDGGRYVTVGVTAARDPATGHVNTGIYRIMVQGSRTLTINAAPDHDLGRLIREAREGGRSLEIAIVIGHHPAFAIGSQLKHGTDIDSYETASSLLDGAFEISPALTIDLPVPARAEIVLEGTIDPATWVPEGPFGEFTNYYGAAHAPRCTISAITHRRDAILHDLHPTHDEHRLLMLFPAREARLLHVLQQSVPSVRGVRFPAHGAALSAYISIDPTREGDARRALLLALASDNFLKHATAVDTDIDLRDDRQVQWAVNVRFQGDRDLITLPGCRGHKFDPSANTVGSDPAQFLTCKLGFDATMPVASAFPVRADLAPDDWASINLVGYLGRTGREPGSLPAHYPAVVDDQTLAPAVAMNDGAADDQA